MIPFGERHLLWMLAEFIEHYHNERNHQGLGNELIDRGCPGPGFGSVRHRERLGGAPQLLLPCSVIRYVDSFSDSAE